MAGGSGPFHGFGDQFPGFPIPKPEDKSEMGVAWNAVVMNGQLFLPATQVVELLQSNNILPKMQAALGRHIAEHTR